MSARIAPPIRAFLTAFVSPLLIASTNPVTAPAIIGLIMFSPPVKYINEQSTAEKQPPQSANEPPRIVDLFQIFPKPPLILDPLGEFHTPPRK